MKAKFTAQTVANMDDARSGTLKDIQQQLDDLQTNGMTSNDIRAVLFNKMLDVYHVPCDHFLRNRDTPRRIDDPKLITQLEQLGFTKKPHYH
ncbi:hypothetical protein [Pseudoalteromonas mariniglutinosa]|uniref:hypothetical protein n=1 Tax=Pseudoalteromonas mariniglutinosa TaxID=206042 RepID=UPI00384EDD2F